MLSLSLSTNSWRAKKKPVLAWGLRKDGGLTSLYGPNPTFASAGATPDGIGGTYPANVLPVDKAYNDVYVGPGYTNKCTCRKTNPVDTTGLIKLGDAASVLSVVDDTAALTAAGLIGVCSLGKVYKLDNSAGVAVAYAEVSGATGVLTAHSGSAYVMITQGTGRLQTGFQNFTPQPLFSGASYVRYLGDNLTSINVGEKLLLRADAGAVIYFILPQLVESPYILPTIAKLPDGTDPLSAVSVVSCAGSVGGNGLSWLMDAKTIAALSGKCIVAALVRMGVASSSITGPNNILSVNDSVSSLIFTDVGGTIKSNDGTNTASVTVSGGWLAGDRFLIVRKTNEAGTKMTLGAFKIGTDTSIQWGSEANYDRSSNPITSLRAGFNRSAPVHIGCAEVWDRLVPDATIIDWGVNRL